MSMTYKIQQVYKYSLYLSNLFPSKILKKIYIKGNYLKIIINYEKLHFFLKFLKKDLNSQFTTLVDLFGVDYIYKNDRFTVNYNLLSIIYNFRLLIAIEINEFQPIYSSHYIYKSSSWLEREIWDMYGIFFLNHPNIRRILTDYGFSGFPLRKDFPQSGYVELRYDDSSKLLVYESLELSQAYRNFDFISPWEEILYKKI